MQKYPEDEFPFDPEELLRTHRKEDLNNDLWTTFNVVQENLLKGGVHTINPVSHRRNTTREVKSISESSWLNKNLWSLAQALGKDKTKDKVSNIKTK